MIEFTAWEVYAYEDGNRPSSALDEGQAKEPPSSKPECQHDQSLIHGKNRIDRVVLAEHLPQISDKALTFESYHVHAEKGIFGGRHDGAIMHWPISQTPSVTSPCVNTLRGHTGAVLTLDFAPDLGPEGVAIIDNNISAGATDDEDPAYLNEHGSSPHDAVELTKTYQFFSASLDGSIRCWDSYEMKASFGFEERDSEITCMVASKHFQKIFTGHDSGVVKGWSIHAGEMLELPLERNGSVTCLATGVVRDQEVLLAGSIDGHVSIWEVNADGFPWAVPFQPTLQSDKKEVTSLVFCKGSFLAQGGQEFFVAGYSSGQIVMWSFAKKSVVCSFRAHSDAVCSMAVHGCFLFSGSDDTLLRMWNMFNLPETYELGVLHPPSSPSSSGSGSPIVCLDVVPMRGLVLSAAADGTLIVWDYTTFEDESAFDANGKMVFRAKADGCIKCLRCWPECKAMICGTAEGKLLVFNLPPHFFQPPELTECMYTRT
ncbi:hypothetical protein PF010_g8880 [Phytophthora fragariae]|uniref:Uncharacterized protein n=1 Tax=Phytophthora fragariae TaxID=53985 RepID=A0A6G0LE46_9STRA|nr:hypothetical protein PF010_g8880 [Phytophthora fragariae]